MSVAPTAADFRARIHAIETTWVDQQEQEILKLAELIEKSHVMNEIYNTIDKHLQDEFINSGLFWRYTSLELSHLKNHSGLYIVAFARVLQKRYPGFEIMLTNLRDIYMSNSQNYRVTFSIKNFPYPNLYFETQMSVLKH